jgi:hypothetical protein
VSSVVQHYDAADDATTVLGVMVPAVSTIAGTAFGVAAGARADAAAGDATAKAARSDAQAVRAQAEQVANRLSEVRSDLEKTVLPAAGSNTPLPTSEVEEARRKLENVEQSLRSAL